MKNLFDPSDNKEIIERINRLSPSAPACWGKMNVAQMVAHAQAPLRIAFGEVKRKRSFFGLLFGRIALKKLIGDQPWQRSLPTDPHFVVSDKREFETERRKLLALVERFVEEGPNGMTRDPHPFFGKLTVDEWSRLQWNHLDHHLAQFGA